MFKWFPSPVQNWPVSWPPKLDGGRLDLRETPVPKRIEMADRQSLDQEDDSADEADILYEDDILHVCDERSVEENG